MPKLGWDLILPVHPKAFTLPQGSTSRQLDPLDADIWHRQIKWLHCCNVDIMLLSIFIPWLWSFKNSHIFYIFFAFIYIFIYFFILSSIVSKSAALDVVVVCRRGEATSDPLREAPTSTHGIPKHSRHRRCHPQKSESLTHQDQRTMNIVKHRVSGEVSRLGMAIQSHIKSDIKPRPPVSHNRIFESALEAACEALRGSPKISKVQSHDFVENSLLEKKQRLNKFRPSLAKKTVKIDGCITFEQPKPLCRKLNRPGGPDCVSCRQARRIFWGVIPLRSIHEKVLNIHTDAHCNRHVDIGLMLETLDAGLPNWIQNGTTWMLSSFDQQQEY